MRFSSGVGLRRIQIENARQFGFLRLRDHAQMIAPERSSSYNGNTRFHFVYLTAKPLFSCKRERAAFRPGQFPASATIAQRWSVLRERSAPYWCSLLF